MHAKHIQGESYESWRQRSEELNKRHQTNPPSQLIGLEDTDLYVDYPEYTEVQWVCPCGCKVFNVFYEEDCYRTFVRCPGCGKQDDVHTG